MTAIWQNNGAGWHLLVPRGFPNEATLHDLVEQTPHLLPLAGNPRLIVIGREVQLVNGCADLIAIEPNGRISVIEIKLARNAEARRAAIASDPCEFVRVGNDPNRLNLPFLHLNGQDGEYLTASADDQGYLTVDFL